eukprot:458946_1
MNELDPELLQTKREKKKIDIIPKCTRSSRAMGQKTNEWFESRPYTIHNISTKKKKKQLLQELHYFKSVSNTRSHIHLIPTPNINLTNNFPNRTAPSLHRTNIANVDQINSELHLTNSPPPKPPPPNNYTTSSHNSINDYDSNINNYYNYHDTSLSLTINLS